MVSTNVKADIKYRDKGAVAVSCIFFIRSTFKTWNTV